MALLVGISDAQDNGVGARAWVDSANYQVGDPIVLRIAVTHPHGVSVRPLVGDTLGAFAVLQHLPIEALGDTVAQTGLVVSYYDSGTVAIPPAEVPYTLQGDSIVRLAMTNPVAVTVHTVAVDTSKEYRDLKPPMSVPMSLGEIALYAGCVLLAGGLVYLAYRLWKRYRGVPRIPAAARVTEPPADELAMKELAAVVARQLLQKGEIKRYYSELTEVIRRYFERRYAVLALEETTGEILVALRGAHVPAAAVDDTQRMLTLADLVKFAKYVPVTSEHDELLRLAYAIVNGTKPVAMTPAASGEVHGGS